MLQNYSHYSEIKGYFSQIKSWFFVTEKTIIVHYINGTEGKRKVYRNSEEDFQGFMEELMQRRPVTAP